MAKDTNKEDRKRRAMEKAAAAARKAASGKKHKPIAAPAKEPIDQPENPEDKPKGKPDKPKDKPKDKPDKPEDKPAAAKAPEEPKETSSVPPESSVEADDQPMLEVKGVWQRYPAPSGGHQVVLSDINLLVTEPQFISVVGPSGCGKSTLLRLVLGSEAPWKGSLRAQGTPIVHPDRSRGIVFQKYSLFPHLTVLQNVTFGLEIDETWLLQKWLTWPWYRKQHQRYKDMAMEYLKTVRLEEHAGKYPHQLSGGMQQRVAIAQAMIMKPAILLMDEPFGALDPGTREDLQLTIIETFEQQQTTIFFVTHDLEEAIFVGNRLLVLSSFYTPEKGQEPIGSKLVMDVPTPTTMTTSDRKKGEFQDFIQNVRLLGFDPAHKQHVEDFDHRPLP